MTIRQTKALQLDPVVLTEAVKSNDRVKKMAEAKERLKTEGVRHRATQDLQFLAVDILGYDLMQGEFSTELFGFLDSNELASDVAVFAPRSAYKTTTMVCLVIQELLRNPNSQIFYIHHRLNNACELVREVGEHIASNEKLRAIWPERHLPKKDDKRFLLAEEFTLPNRLRKIRHPSLKAYSLEMNLTGQHPDVVFLDDLVNFESVRTVKGGADAIEEWVRHTLTNIRGLNANVKNRLVGTVWSDRDFHWKIISGQEPGWEVFHRAISEDPETKAPLDVDDPRSKPIPLLVPDIGEGFRYLGKNDIRKIKAKAKGYFNSQYMMVPNIDMDTPWDMSTCEHYVSDEDIYHHIQKIIIINDPSGTENVGGDDWAIAVIGYLVVPLEALPDELRGLQAACEPLGVDKARASGTRVLRVLLDGRAANNWTIDQAMRINLNLAEKWSTPYIAMEEGLGAAKGLLSRKLKEVAKRHNVRVQVLSLEDTRFGKNIRIRNLASIADEGEFLICNTVDERFLKKFLNQARGYSGPKSLANDDCLDAVAYLDDYAIRAWLPRATPRMANYRDHSSGTETFNRRSRYINY